MASRKEYEMLFALNAQMNSGFSSTFTKAQSEFAKLGNEIQNLSKVQADISAYQKQQNAITATSSKLENLKQQHDLLQKEINETTESTTSLEREKLKLEQRISDTESALERQKQKLDATGAKLKEAGVDTSNLSGESAKLTAQIDDLRQQQEKAADSAENFGASGAQAFETIQQAIAAAGIAAALKEIADAYMECVTNAAGFEATMSTVEALSGASSDELEELNAMAKQLGATTKFTATESAQAMTYMAMAGWSANEMLAGMDGVLQLAAASGEDLAMVSDIVTDNLTAFGLTAADTAHFADVLAAAATSSNTSVSIMGETFKNCAAIAGALNYSIDDVAVAVGLMANAGVKGSNAGTALKNTFNGLLSGVTLTGAALGEYEFTAVKADGTMKDFASTIDELRGCFDQMTEAERVQNAQAIAGERTYNGLLAILNATDEEYASLSASIADCSGAAATMAAIKLDNLNGELTLMNSAWDALKTTIGEQFIPEMRTLYSIGTDVFGAADSFVQKAPQLVKAGTAVAGVLGLAAGGIMGVNTALKAFKALNMAAAFTSTAGIAVMAAAGIAALTAACFELASSSNEAIEAWNDMIDAHEAASREYQESIDSIDKETESTLGLVDQLRELSAQSDKTAADKAQIVSLCDQLNQAIPNLALSYDAESDSLVGLTGTLDGYIESLYEAQRSEATIARMTELKGNIYQTDAALKEATEQLKYWQKQYDSLAASGGDLWAAQNNLDTYRAKVAELNEILEGEQAEYDELYDEYNDYIAAQEAAAESTANQSAETEALNDAIESVTERMAALTEAYNEVYGAALESIQGQYSLWEEAAEVVATSASDINSALESQITYWQDYNANLQSLTERSADIEGLSDVIASFADGSAESVNAIAGMATASDEDLAAMVANWQMLQKEQENASGSIADLKTDFTAVMDELQKELETDIEAMDLGTEAAESGRATIQGFIGGAVGMQSQVEVAYAKIAQAAIAAIDKQLDIHSPSRVMMEKAQMTWAGFINQTQAMTPEIQAAMAGAARAGTDAVPNNAVDAKYGGGGGASYLIELSPIYNLSGVSNAAELETILHQHDEELRQQILDLLEEISADKARRAFK